MSEDIRESPRYVGEHRYYGRSEIRCSLLNEETRQGPRYFSERRDEGKFEKR